MQLTLACYILWFPQQPLLPLLCSPSLPLHLQDGACGFTLTSLTTDTSFLSSLLPTPRLSCLHHLLCFEDITLPIPLLSLGIHRTRSQERSNMYKVCPRGLWAVPKWIRSKVITFGPRPQTDCAWWLLELLLRSSGGSLARLRPLRP